MEDIVGDVTKTKIAEEDYLVGTAVASQEWERRMGTTVGGGVVNLLFGHLVERCSSIGLVGVLRVDVSGAA